MVVVRRRGRQQHNFTSTPSHLRHNATTPSHYHHATMPSHHRHVSTPSRHHHDTVPSQHHHNTATTPPRHHTHALSPPLSHPDFTPPPPHLISPRWQGLRRSCVVRHGGWWHKRHWGRGGESELPAPAGTDTSTGVTCSSTTVLVATLACSNVCVGIKDLQARPHSLMHCSSYTHALSHAHTHSHAHACTHPHSHALTRGFWRTPCTPCTPCTT
jgi:hypothetical protein